MAGIYKVDNIPIRVHIVSRIERHNQAQLLERLNTKTLFKSQAHLILCECVCVTLCRLDLQHK